MNVLLVGFFLSLSAVVEAGQSKIRAERYGRRNRDATTETTTAPVVQMEDKGTDHISAVISSTVNKAVSNHQITSDKSNHLHVNISTSRKDRQTAADNSSSKKTGESHNSYKIKFKIDDKTKPRHKLKHTTSEEQSSRRDKEQLDTMPVGSVKSKTNGGKSKIRGSGCGSRRTTCCPGPPGLPGIVGPPGQCGIQGIQGVQGVQGSQGQRGPTGPQGPTAHKGNIIFNTFEIDKM